MDDKSVDLDLDNSDDFSGMNDTALEKKDSESMTFTWSDLSTAPDILPYNGIIKSSTPSINCTSIAAVTCTFSIFFNNDVLYKYITNMYNYKWEPKPIRKFSNKFQTT